MRFLKSAAAFIGLAMLASPFVYAEASAEADDVLVLNKDNFDSHVDPAKLMLVKFYAPWCGHCQAMAPDYKTAATTLKKEDITLAKVDCTIETDLCQKYDVQGFPTLKVFREGKAHEYKGGRKLDEILSTMRKQKLPAVSEVTSENLKKFSEMDRVVLVGFFKSGSAEYKAYEAVAKEYRDEYIFGAAVDAKLAEKEGVKVPGVILYKQFDEKKVVYPGKLNKDEIVEFIKTQSIPIMDEVTPENYALYIESKKPLAFFYWDTEEVRTKYGAFIEKVAKDFKSKVNFVYIDANKFGGHAESLALELKWPAFGIQNIEQQLKYPFDQSKEITEKSIREFVQSFVDGKLKYKLKSAAAPEKNDEPVKVVVGTTFESIVLDTEKDVLLELYAPWCGHCKKLAPIWDKLGKRFASVSDKIVIAKMDATENDVPPETNIVVEGFPTIKLVKAKTNEILEYSGEREVEGFIEFLRENAFHKDFKIPDAEKDEKPKSDDASSERDEL